MPQPSDTMKCPSCHATMQPGFLPVSGGMNFVRGDGRAASSFAEGVPGTNAIMRSNRLPAWRCKACSLILFRYGKDNAKQLERELGFADEVEPVEPEEEGEEDPFAIGRKRD
ncbi:MAG: PF20097 family protein [Planctomycetota bacterium]